MTSSSLPLSVCLGQVHGHPGSLVCSQPGSVREAGACPACEQGALTLSSFILDRYYRCFCLSLWELVHSFIHSLNYLLTQSKYMYA